MAPRHFLLLIVAAVVAAAPHWAYAQPDDGFQSVRPTPLPSPRPPPEQRSLPSPPPAGSAVTPRQSGVFEATVACSAHLVATGREAFRQQVIVRIADRRLTYERPYGGVTVERGVEQASGQVAENGDVIVTGSQVTAGRSMANVAFRGNIYGPAPQLRGEYRLVGDGRVFRTCELTFVDQPRR